MNVYAWILVVFMTLSSLVIIGTVGQPRKTLTPSDAVAITVINLLLIFLVIKAAT